MRTETAIAVSILKLALNAKTKPYDKHGRMRCSPVRLLDDKIRHARHHIRNLKTNSMYHSRKRERKKQDLLVRVWHIFMRRWTVYERILENMSFLKKLSKCLRSSKNGMIKFFCNSFECKFLQLPSISVNMLNLFTCFCCCCCWCGQHLLISMWHQFNFECSQVVIGRCLAWLACIHK